MPNALNRSSERVILHMVCWLLIATASRGQGPLAIANGVSPEPEWYASSCAAKLFLYGGWGYERILNTTERIVQERIARYELRNKRPPPLAGIVTEYERARPLLEFLTNRYPKRVESFLAPDDDEYIAQHIWTTMLLNYQDGERRIVRPRDIRTLLFVGDVVQPVLAVPPDNVERHQFADAQMVETGARLFLESADQWEGRLDRLQHPNPQFNRRAHERFWWSFCAYVGILRSYDPAAAVEYVEDMVMLRNGNLHRWLWDSEYFAGIRETYAPDSSNQLWTHPREVLIGLITTVLPDQIPSLLDLTGKALLDMTDRIITSPVLFDARVAVLSPGERLEGAGGLAARIRGVEEYADRSVMGDEARVPYEINEAVPAASAEELREALMKWQYYFHLHTRMLQEQGRGGCAWLGVLMETRLPILEAIRMIVSSREAQASDVESNYKRASLKLQEAEGCVQYGEHLPEYKKHMQETATEVIDSLVRDEGLEPELRDLAMRISMKWGEARQNDRPGDRMMWDDWQRKIHQLEYGQDENRP